MMDHNRHNRDALDDYTAHFAPDAPPGLQDRILAMAAQTAQKKTYRPFAFVNDALAKLADGIAAAGRMGWAPQLACAVFIICVAFGAGINSAATTTAALADEENTIIALAYGEYSGEAY